MRLGNPGVRFHGIMQANIVTVPVAECSFVRAGAGFHDLLVLERIVAAKMVQILLDLASHGVKRHDRRVIDLLLNILIVCLSQHSLPVDLKALASQFCLMLVAVVILVTVLCSRGQLGGIRVSMFDCLRDQRLGTLFSAHLLFESSIRLVTALCSSWLVLIKRDSRVRKAFCLASDLLFELE